ncbi:MAG: hypothetical protein GY813_20245 [Halieaceae bacterium]|nr:hypothetical protein [Halieaceae bacterium]
MSPYRTAKYGRICIRCGAHLDAQRILRNTSVRGVEVDYCQQCGGLWLDEGELQELAKHPAKVLSAVESLVLTHPRPTDGMKAHQPCPACQGPLMTVTFGPTIIESCSNCGGVFLDHGELEKAIEAFGSKVSTIVALSQSVSVSSTLDK